MEPQTNERFPARDIALVLDIKGTIADDSDQREDGVRALVPGEPPYTFVIYCPNPIASKKNPIPHVTVMSPPMMRVIRTAGRSELIFSESIAVHADDLTDSYLCESLSVTVPGNCYNEFVEFTIQLYAAPSNEWRSSGSLKVHLLGSEYPRDEALMEVVGLDPTLEPPPGTAIVHIEQLSDEQVWIKGWCSNGRLAPTLVATRDLPERLKQFGSYVEQQIERMRLSLGAYNGARDNQAQKLREQEIRGYLSKLIDALFQGMRTFPDHPLLGWLQNLYNRHGRNLTVIFGDHTTLEIPWELLGLHEPTPDGLRTLGHLGALARVVRWLPVQDAGLTYPLRLVDETWSGNVLAYVDDGLDSAMIEREHAVLGLFEPRYCADPQRIVEHLGQRLDGYALIYLASHGIFVHGDEHERSWQTYGKRGQYPLTSLSLERLPTQMGKRPLVVVNACHSARLSRLSDEGRYLYGLHDVMLAKCASGFIGTTGPVVTEFAASIIEHMLRAATKPDGALIAEELRHIRYQAAAAYRAAENDTLGAHNRAMWDYLSAFLYVYYGNPVARLRLTPSPQQAATGPEKEAAHEP